MAKEEGPNGALTLEFSLLWLLCLPLVAKDGVEDKAVGEQEEVMVKEVKPALSGFHPDNDVNWKHPWRQGLRLGQGYRSLQGDKGNPRSFWSDQICELQLV